VKPRMSAWYWSPLDHITVAQTSRPALVIFLCGALGRQQMFAVASWHRWALPPARLHHRR
jgi:hypothetical protein